MKQLKIRRAVAQSAIFAPLLLASAVAAAVDEVFVLEEVIVTAQKRVQNLQDVPISMSAVDGQKISDAGMNDLQALSSSVPGLQIGVGAVSDNIFIRGVGSGSNRAFEQSVGMYIDGAYMGRSLQYRSPFLDVERVEVLRGPQGVLFGKNTVAGVVNITTASPSLSEETTAKVSAEFEPETDSQVYTAIMDTTFSENLGARVAVKYRDAEGWVDNALLDEEEASNEEISARISVLWEPTDDLSANLKLSYSNMDSFGNPIVLTAFEPVSSDAGELAAVSQLAPIGFAVANMAYPEIANYVGQDFTGYKNNNNSLYDEGMELETRGAVLNIDWSFENFTLASVTAYSTYENTSGLDGDFGPLDFISAGGKQDFDQLSQEFRLSTTSEGPIDWTVGAYFEQQTLEVDGTVGINSSFGQPAIVSAITGGYSNLFSYLSGGAYTVDSIYRHNRLEQDAETVSAFAQAVWEVNPQLRVTFGLRYAVDEKEVDKTLLTTDDNLGQSVSDSDPDNYLLQSALDGMWAGFGTYRHDFNGVDRRSENLTPGLSVEWDVSEDSMVYLSYSEGYKSGGFNGADDLEAIDLDGDGIGETPTEDYEYEDEEVKTVELGGKFTLAEGTMRLNWALFHTEYTNLQVTSFNGTSFTVGNAAETTIEGAEVEWQWQATEFLNVSANVAYLDYAYDKYDTASCNVDAQLGYVLANPGASASGCVADLSGETGVFAPEWSGAISVAYEREIAESLVFQLGGDANYKDEYYTDDDLNDASLQDATWKFDLRAGLKSISGDWEVMLFGNNITDEQTLTAGQDGPLLSGMHVGYVDKGRVWGLRGTYNFD